MVGFYNAAKEKISRFLDSFYAGTPESRVVTHCGVKKNENINFPKILIVDDVPQYVQNSFDVIRKHYSAGEIVISLAYRFSEAATFFENDPADLVVLDVDLQDNLGDGRHLAKKFLEINPGVVILANSKKGKYNKMLIDLGAKEALGKKKARLAKWLEKNEPMSD